MNPHGRAARGRYVLVVAALAMLADGCGLHALRREIVQPGALSSVSHGRNTVLKAHLRDGQMVVFTSWELVDHDRMVRGTGQLYDGNRRPQGERTFELALDSVALFESDELKLPGAIVPIAVMTGASIMFSVLCLTTPKACFGSCPTFYAWDGEREALVAEGFSSSVAPALEATDLDALDRVRPRDGRVVLTMVNEALETHVVRRADLMLAPRPAGGRVVSLPDGSLIAATDWRAPDAASGEEGDCLSRIAGRDAVERTSLADSSDLAQRETIELRFDAPPRGPLGVVITARQSLLSTYLFYQTLAWMGRSAGTWLAALSTADDGARSRAGAVGRELGGIEVQVERGGRWEGVGEYRETGPLASDTRVIRLPELDPEAAAAGPDAARSTASGAATPLRIRLSLTRGLWRLDRVALVVLGTPVTAQALAPARVLRHGRPDAAALACLVEHTGPIVTQPGDTLSLVYELPAGRVGDELFLQSRGYYLEWMRDAWLAEESPEKLARMFLAPRAALRELAPAYKRVEPELEATFWGSRYAR